jgi:hypothetical protein
VCTRISIVSSFQLDSRGSRKSAACILGPTRLAHSWKHIFEIVSTTAGSTSRRSFQFLGGGGVAQWRLGFKKAKGDSHLAIEAPNYGFLLFSFYKTKTKRNDDFQNGLAI